MKLLLERHGAELGEDERRAMRLAIEELEGLIGSVLVSVEPANARVTINGQLVPPEQRGKRLRVNVGEHTVVAEAAGYARDEDLSRGRRPKRRSRLDRPRADRRLRGSDRRRPRGGDRRRRKAALAGAGPARSHPTKNT